MNNIAIEFKKVGKKFKKGEKYNSIRDLIPSLIRNLIIKSYKSEKLEDKEFWALKNISFQVKKGEALGIIGPNGAGKSTILKLLSGIIKPTYGEINIYGRLSALIEIGAGFHPDLTGRENIYLNASILGMKKKEIEKKFDDIVNFSELSDFIDTPVKRYSSGMYARLGFSVAAHVEPDILLVDEVLSVGDFKFQNKCINKMKEFEKKGVTIIFISHNIPSVNMLCKKTILLNQGSISDIGNSKDVCRKYFKAYYNTKKIGTTNLLDVMDVHLSSGDGLDSTTYLPGNWISVNISVKSSEQIKKSIMGFFVKREDGVIVFDANSDKFSKKYFNFHNDEIKTINLKFRNNLPKGTYFIGIHFMNELGEFYFYNDDLINFYVNAPKSDGDAFLDLIW